MDISHINDIARLKALAYDALVRMKQAERDLTIIENRIVILSQIQDHEIKKMLTSESIDEKVDSPSDCG